MKTTETPFGTFLVAVPQGYSKEKITQLTFSAERMYSLLGSRNSTEVSEEITTGEKK